MTHTREYLGDCRTGLDAKDANTALVDCRAERDRLREVNRELVAALEESHAAMMAAYAPSMASIRRFSSATLFCRSV